MIKILDIPFYQDSKEQLLSDLANQIESKKIFMVTPNPEILLETLKNPELKRILQKLKHNIPDGYGILWAHYFLSKSRHKSMAPFFFFYSLLTIPFWLGRQKKFNKVITGTDLFQQICLDSRFNKYKKFLLGARNNAALDATKKLRQQNPDVNIVGTFEGSPSTHEKAVDLINQSQADMLFVAYGCPKQEFWISDHLQDLKYVNFAIGIGGAFDFVAGHVKRAPVFMRKSGLEWLFRLFQEPRKRIKRIFNAVIVFPLKVLAWRLKH